jgi:mannose-6-phosphate isomerase-like protein (cupin superfamily)
MTGDPLDLVEWRPGVRTRLHLSAATGATALCVMEQWCDPGLGAPIHTHFDVEEAILVVSGAADFVVDGTSSRVEAGGTILLPARSWHGFTNTGDGELHTVAVFASAAPPVAYRDEPEVVYEIGVAGARMRDPHRAVRPPGS